MHGVPSLQTTEDAAAAVYGPQLRELLLYFPCAVLDGVRWSVLCKILRERTPLDLCSAPPPTPSPAFYVAYLADIAYIESHAGGSNGDVRLRLRDESALAYCYEGKLACWPLLVQRLTEIVHAHGALQSALDIEAGSCGADEMVHFPAEPPDAADPRAVAVLLSQLKPFLRQYWDPAFEERQVGFFNQAGTYVSVKKMKHLVAELLKWRAKRRSLVAAGTLAPGVVDQALATPIALAVSRKHNDMLLCCPRPAGGGEATSSEAVAQPEKTSLHKEHAVPKEAAAAAPNGTAKVVTSSSNALPQQRPQSDSKAQIEVGPAPTPKLPVAEAPAPASSSSLQSPSAARIEESPVANPYGRQDQFTPPSPSHAQLREARYEAVEKENRRLRIENAELKKRLRFDTEAMHKEIRRLRVESAELKKRLYFGNYYMNPRGQPQQLQPTLVAFAPMGTAPAGASVAPQGFNSACNSPASGPAAAVPAMQAAAQLPVGAAGHAMAQQAGASGQASPSQGAMTPISHQHFCYAVPVTQGVLAVGPGQPWPATSSAGMVVAGFPTAMTLGVQAISGNGGSTMSPFSDASVQERMLLPKSLFGSDHNSSHVSDVVSPDTRSHAQPNLEAPPVRFHATDDRWVCIPSGIVERQVAQFDSSRVGAEGADDQLGEETALQQAGGDDLAASPREERGGAGVSDQWPSLPLQQQPPPCDES
eukprot:TRINITY_DN4038_c0_g4_i1.p1 TRINITY_DN4038_c0_g4~~TRINITY_DN4038_c0_g4_i1.p1  ORF type:complete len:704 (-),score=168.16 TRINITY_DN4038_c0_g4_i1:450-2561(-)